MPLSIFFSFPFLFPQTREHRLRFSTRSANTLTIHWSIPTGATCQAAPDNLTSGCGTRSRFQWRIIEAYQVWRTISSSTHGVSMCWPEGSAVWGGGPTSQDWWCHSGCFTRQDWEIRGWGFGDSIQLEIYLELGIGSLISFWFLQNSWLAYLELVCGAILLSIGDTVSNGDITESDIGVGGFDWMAVVLVCILIHFPAPYTGLLHQIGSHFLFD